MMKQNRMRRGLLFLLAALILAAATAVCVWAVPARPGGGLAGESAACRSHPGALVTLDKIPERKSGPNRAPSIAPTGEKTIPLLIIVIGFSDMPYVDSYDWSETIFDGPKSLSAYYSDMSFGKFTFSPAAESCAFYGDGNTNTADKVNDGVVHVKLNVPHKDWANEDEYPAQAEAMIAAIEQADAYVDFAAFDANEDGAITENELAVGFVFAGYEASDAYPYYDFDIEKYLWAHAWTLSDLIVGNASELSVPTPDGTEVSAYIAIAEQLQDGTQEPISVLAHELGHYLGLPDLYDTSNKPSEKWGKYDVNVLSVMASGSWGTDPDGNYTPYSMDIWSRWALGWCTLQAADCDGDYTVTAQSYTDEDAFAAVYVPTQREGEYYLLENRQFTRWDAGLADKYSNYTAGGIILWHIDDAVFEQYNATNEVNDTFHRPAVMPLYPEKTEKTNTNYIFIGNTAAVYKGLPFFSLSKWNELFPNTAALNLPLYGTGDNADKRSYRGTSGLKLSFLDDGGPTMTVHFDTGGQLLHRLQAVGEVAATCTEPGNSAYWYCEACGKFFSDENGENEIQENSWVIAPNGHTFDRQAATDAYKASDATCTAKATYYYSCVCGEKGTETFESGDMLPHTYDRQAATDAYKASDATCTAKATYYYSCVCGEKGTETFESGDMLPHTYDRQVATDVYKASDATCTAKATYYYSCVCGEKGTETFESGDTLPHTYGVPAWAWAGDHSSAAATFTCQCGDRQTVTDRAPAKTVVRPAAATEDQVVTYTATVQFAGGTYTAKAENISVPGTATGAPAETGEKCPWCGERHGSSFGDRIAQFFHRILYALAHMLGLR